MTLLTAVAGVWDGLAFNGNSLLFMVIYVW
jgi:hypothetical protein